MKKNIPMHRTKIIIASAALFAVLIIIVLGFSGHKDKGHEYILDKNNKIKLSDVQTYYEYREFDEEDVRYYFKDDILKRPANTSTRSCPPVLPTGCLTCTRHTLVTG
jgi:hypothetical protein